MPQHLYRTYGHPLIEPHTLVELEPHKVRDHWAIPWRFAITAGLVEKTVRIRGVADSYTVRERYDCPACDRDFFLLAQYRAHVGRCMSAAARRVAMELHDPVDHTDNVAFGTGAIANNLDPW